MVLRRKSVKNRIQTAGLGLLVGLFLASPFCAVGQSAANDSAWQNQKVAVMLAVDTLQPIIDSIHKLQDVKVHTAILPEVLTCIDPVQIITRAQPTWQDGLSVSDMVRYFSGVQLKDYGGVGGLKTVNVRSLGTRHTAVLLDGLPLENAQNGQVDLGRYGLSDLGSISIYKNQNSQIFQAATAFASSNAIYLESRLDQLDSLHPAKASINLQTGSFGLLNGAFYGSTRLSKVWQMQGSISVLRARGNYPYTYTNGVYDTTLKREGGDVKRYIGRISLYGQFKDSSSLSLTAYGFRRQMGLPGAIVSNKFSNKERQDESDYYLQASYLKPIGGNDHLKLQFKYNHSYLKYSNPDITRLYVSGGDTIAAPLTNHYRQSSYFFSGANIYQLTSDWQVDFSADLHYDHLNMDLNGKAHPSRWTTYAAVASKLALGRMHLAGNLLYTAVKDHQQIKNDWISQSKFSPSLSASWQPFKTNALKFRAFYKRSFQMPTFNDLYLTQFNQTALRPENSKQYNLGLYYFLSWPGFLKTLLIEADAYYNNVQDKIVAIPTTSLFRWQMVNLGLARIKGLDFTAKTSWGIAEWIFLTSLQYTYQDARDYTDPGSVTYKNILPYIPKHSGSFTLSAVNKHFGVNYSFIYDGERYSERFNSLVSYVPAWYTHDLSVSYGWTLAKNIKAKLLFSLDNVLNQHYDVIENYPMPGRNFKLGMQFEF
ncbi:TonB-dependent receptor [Arachidicoccus ginsenosidivorans]|nr:TonB-dependent receptor [Arachidicoccus ginsenosidivorans]